MAFLKKNRLHSAVGLLALSIALAGCGGGPLGGVFDKLPDADSKAKTKTTKASGEVYDGQAEVLAELQALRAELQKRSGALKQDLSAAKQELARRQGAGEIDQAKVNLSPSEIRDSQLSELEKLKAELERRKSGKEAKERAISTSLVENEAIYRNVDACLKRASGDFRNTFDGRSDLTKIVSEKKSQVYQNSDRSLLILTTDKNCDISFTGTSIDDYTTGLVHILETQGGVVENKKVAGINVISVAHPRGNFRLASGKKVIGQGGSTNLYTTIKAL
ncbi:MAG: hypothetical protein ABJ081_00990 [Hyphomicrobiales bacterium]